MCKVYLFLNEQKFLDHGTLNNNCTFRSYKTCEERD